MITYERKQILKKEIDKAIQIIEESESLMELLISFSGINTFEQENDYDKLYNFATEDMRTYYKEFGNPETFLTIGASGDQLLNAIKIGAKKIDVFDLNKLSKRQSAKKIAAAKVLTPQELYQYFTALDESLYQRFSHKLSEEDSILWQSLFDYVGAENLEKLYPYHKLSKELIFQINPYLDEEGYEEFQRQLESVEINYIDSDLYSLPELLGNNTYDAINLSNVYEYLNFGKDTSQENAKKYYDFIMKTLYERLNSNGTIMVAYMYAFNDYVKKHFDEMLTQNEGKMTVKGLLVDDEIDYYYKGFTSQNYSYSLLLDAFAHENIKKVPTSNIVYGQSIDKSHDLALCLKK